MTQKTSVLINKRDFTLLSDDHAIRHRPVASEWSTVEVVGHMIDKMWIWTGRVERLMAAERPALPAYDQDALLLEPTTSMLIQRCYVSSSGRSVNALQALLSMSQSPLWREGMHEEVGPMTIRQCIAVPLESSPEHLKQLQAAQTLV